jgi:hypothetical protein
MDSGQGRFDRLSEVELRNLESNNKPAINRQKLFRVDEVVKIKESYFRIKEIFNKAMKLRLLSDVEVEDLKSRGLLEKEKVKTELQKMLEQRQEDREKELMVMKANQIEEDREKELMKMKESLKRELTAEKLLWEETLLIKKSEEDKK